MLVLLAALVLGPQRSARRASSRPDNLRMAAAIMAAHERRGDAVLYLSSNKRASAWPIPRRTSSCGTWRWRSHRLRRRI
jgi:hypothetical protein